MNIKNLMIGLSLGSFFFSLQTSHVLGVANSMDTTETNKVKTSDQIEIKKQAQAGKKIDRCNLVQQKIASKAKTLNLAREQRLQAAKQMQTRLSSLIPKLTQKGYDTTTLKNDLVILDQKIATYSESYGAYIRQITESREQACLKTEADFKSGLSDNRNMFQMVKNDNTDLRNFYTNTIRKDIMALKNQKITPDNK